MLDYVVVQDKLESVVLSVQRRVLDGFDNAPLGSVYNLEICQFLNAGYYDVGLSLNQTRNSVVREVELLQVLLEFRLVIIPSNYIYETDTATLTSVNQLNASTAQNKFTQVASGEQLSLVDDLVLVHVHDVYESQILCQNETSDFLSL